MRATILTGSVAILALVFLVATVAAEGFYIEAESIAPVSPWVKSTSKSGYSGTCYFENTAGMSKSPKGILMYPFNITKEGIYIVTLRGRRDHEGSCATALSDECNDVFSKMDDRSWCKTMIKGNWGSWVWESRTAECDHGMTFTLTPGKHTFYVAARSNGLKFDALTIHLNGTPRPTGSTSVVSRPSSVARSSLTTTAYNLRGMRVGRAAMSVLSTPSLTGVLVVRSSDGHLVRALVP